MRTVMATRQADRVGAYWINTFREIRDREKVGAYIALAGPTMRAAGGTFRARGMWSIPSPPC